MNHDLGGEYKYYLIIDELNVTCADGSSYIQQDVTSIPDSAELNYQCSSFCSSVCWDGIL